MRKDFLDGYVTVHEPPVLQGRQLFIVSLHQHQVSNLKAKLYNVKQQ